ncbi:MAG: hypothetical protein KZQ77_05610 [Candidatus Thiodiazotropha sp. (ex Notomyrtea botanica)]|nr:hypothetical protein [Candidatus Thiodiazotropha sp. (ex Notomyrtea botanica)]
MPQNLVSAELDESEQQAILATIQQLQSLPFLIGLSNKKKRSLNKMGDKSRAFVDSALNIVKQNPDILPATLDVAELEKDILFYERLYPINIALSKLSELVDSTLIAAGSDAYTGALDVYAYAKINSGVSGLEELRGMLGNRFKGRGVKKEAEAPEEIEITNR